MSLYKYNGVILREGGAIAASEDCCCGGPCCEFIPCEGEGDPLYYLCESIPEGIQIGDVVEIGNDCYEYNGEVDCEGDEVDGSFGDTYETCDECICPCLEFENCQNSASIVRYKYCKPFDPVLSVGDVILIGATCYELLGGVTCENDEPELTDPDVYDECNDCLCTCFRGSRCGNPNSTLDFKICGNTNGVDIGDIIRVGDVCYTITHRNVSCVGVTEQENRPTSYENCDDCCPRFKGIDCLGESIDRVWRVCDPTLIPLFRAASVFRISGNAGEPLCICYLIEETTDPVTSALGGAPASRLFDSCEDCYIPGFCAP